MRVLAGDIGGTKTVLGLFGPDLESIARKSYPSAQYASLAEIVRAFVEEMGAGRVDRAAFGIAGPVRDGRSKTTNLPWLVDARDLESELRVTRVGLLNDLEATAHGIRALGPKDFELLAPGAAGAQGNQAVIAAGTGLGEAGLYWDGESHRPFASEGGHASFAADNDLAIELLRYLQKRFEQVSWERVVSGPGLHHIYQFFRDTGRGAESQTIARRLTIEDPSAVISAAALTHADPLSESALDLFARLYGAEAGNLALKMMATGGLFVGGGIAPKILPKLKEGGFLEAFTAKGPMSDLVRSIPVRVVLNDQAALIGAARFALTAFS